MDPAPNAPAATQLPVAGGPQPDPMGNSVTDIRSLLPQLKEVLASATHADDDGILEIWVQLCRAIAFFGPSSNRIRQEPIASYLQMVVVSAEGFVERANAASRRGCGADKSRSEVREQHQNTN